MGLYALIRRLIALMVLCLACSTQAIAGPWAAPGDVRLRHDLQLLGDSGLLDIPLTSWPISWGDISHALAPPSSSTDDSVVIAYRRVKKRLAEEFEPRQQIKAHTKLGAAATPIRFRSFADTPRATAEAEVGVEWMGDMLALKLQGAVVRDPEDGKQFRPDGSYAGMALGNWMFSAGWMERWWGPGWDGSLIMSNNARPVPALAIQRNYSDPFDVPVLRWLGPWNFTFYTGVTEGDRVVPHALISGMRLSIKPLPGLEIGLSRGMQWGGSGRPQNLITFLRSLAGRDNTGQKGITRANQPGNQLAGYSMRWASPLFDLPYALYTQWIGEDESRSFPISYMAIMGGEIWGGWGSSGASWRLHAEYADTEAHLLGGSHGGRNIAYNHSVYRSGYRYYGRSLGHSIDGDGLSFSFGAVLIDSRGRSWEMLLRDIRTNRDGISPGPVKIPAERTLAVELRSKFDSDYGEFQLGASLYRSRLNGAVNVSYRSSLDMQWKYQY